MKSDERFLVTGALGCLGAWTVARLAHEGTPVIALDAQEDPRRLAMLLDERGMTSVTRVRGDIADGAQVDDILDRHRVTHIIHLAALIHPLFRADPRRGVRVNAGGSVNIFEAAARRPTQVQRIVYASSIAVYDGCDAGDRPVPHDLVGRPTTLYGVFKQAEEGMARVFHDDTGVSSIGIRPATVFGAGRDQGLTAGPTLAIQAAAAGESFHIGYQGRSHLHYADDLARIFIACARSGFRGADVFNVDGITADMAEIVAGIEAAAPAARGRITHGGGELALPHDYDDSALRRVIGTPPRTSLAEAIRMTLDVFRGRKLAPEPRDA